MHPAPATTPRSYAFENAVFALVIPAAVLLVAWVWFGRAFLGAGGWFLLLFAITLVPVLVIALGLTTVLSFTQRRPESTGRLTRRQAWAHVVLWVALAAFGFFVVDFGDAADSANSVFTVMADGSKDLGGLSTTIALVAAAVAAAAWIWLLVELVTGNGEAKRQRAAETQRQWEQWHAQQARWQQWHQQSPPGAPPTHDGSAGH